MKKVNMICSNKTPIALYQRAIIQDDMPSNWILIIIGLVIGFINGFFGGGGGMVCVPTLSNVVGLPEKQSHATAILIMLSLSVVSIFVYAFSKEFEWKYTLWVGFGFVTGGVLGALLLKSIKNIVLNIVFALLILASGFILLFR